MEVDIEEIQGKLVASIPNFFHGLLNLAPRVGKTKITIALIKREEANRILWVTPNTKLRDIDIPAEFKKWKALTYLKRTDIICYASLSEHTGVYDKIVLDEYQNLTEANVAPFFNGSIAYKTIVGLSGTHPKHKEKLEILERLDLKIFLSMTIDEAVNKSLIAPYKITVIECELEDNIKTIKAGSKSKPFLTTERAQYKYLSKLIACKVEAHQPVPVFLSLNRMRFLYNVESKNNFAKKLLKKLKGRTIIFSGSIQKAEFISKYTFHSKTDDKNLTLFKEGKIDELSLVNSGGVGHTFHNVDNLIIVQVNSNRKGDSTQKIARSLVFQKGYEANIYILVCKDTVDESWKNKVLEDFNKDKITHVSWEKYE